MVVNLNVLLCKKNRAKHNKEQEEPTPAPNPRDVLVYENKKIEYLNTTINPSKTTRTRCSPTTACDSYDIKTIPYMLEHVRYTFPSTYTMIDYTKIRECLKGKRILLLGDKTMAELFHDLAILLSGG